MDIDNLIKMANQIGDFFGAWRDQQEGRDGIANHLKRSWDPRMRRQIAGHVQETGGAGLSPIVIEAIRQLGAEPDAAQR